VTRTHYKTKWETADNAVGALAKVIAALQAELNASTRALEAERARSAALQAEVERMRDALLLIRTRASTFAQREDFIDAVFSTPSGIGQPVQSPTSTEKKT
jgi:chromosome segregation ATPase